MNKLQNIKKEFPIFRRTINGKPLIYLDNASTSQKPRVVLDALSTYYRKMNANVHRGIHTLSEESTVAYEKTRKKVADFIYAKKPEQIVFTKNCTESLNLVAWGFAYDMIKQGDEIIVSALEHHSNLVPWQEIARQKKARLRVIPLQKNYTLDYDAYLKLLSSKTKLVCITAQSNALGTIPPLKKMIAAAHEVGAVVLVDGAQSVGHMKTNVQALDCDFFAFSAHKMLGPTGVGVLYGKSELLEKMRPLMYGGDMVTTVGQYSAEYQKGPARFEAGTPNIADVIAFGSSLDFLSDIGLDAIHEHDQELVAYAQQLFSHYKEVQLFVPPLKESGGTLSFAIPGIHPHDIATVFDSEGIAIRSGLHCAEPLVRSLGVDATARMSFYLYNTKEDVQKAEKALQKVLKIFKK